MKELLSLSMIRGRGRCTSENHQYFEGCFGLDKYAVIRECVFCGSPVPLHGYETMFVLGEGQ